MLISNIPALRTKLAAVETLNRQIYASLPWGYRVAQVLVKLSYDLTDTVGRVFYSLFLKSGVTDMPPGANPGTKPERLPRGYGLKFGQKLYGFLLKKLRNPAKVEEVLSNLMVQVSKGKFKVNEGTPLAKAESYVFQAAVRAAVDFSRSERGRKDRGYNESDVSDEGLDISDPRAFQNLDELLPEHDLDLLLEELEDIDQRAPSWLKAQVEGVTNVELAEQWGVSKARVTQWEQINLPKIKNVVKDFVRDLN